jgi:nucleoside phosphorylase
MLSTYKKDIFLHFFNPDLRNYLGFYNKLTFENHSNYLSDKLNLSILLTKNQVYLPPTFLDCPINMSVLENKILFFESQLIRLPLRENDPNSFILKKIEEYQPSLKDYADYRLNKGKKILSFLMKVGYSFIKRNSIVGDEIAKKWLEAPDSDTNWKEILNAIETKEIELIRKVPSYLREENRAVLAGNIIRFIKDEKKAGLIHPLLYDSYSKIYINEYDSTIFEGLPLFEHFSKYENNPYYNFKTFSDVLRILGIYNEIIKLPPEQILKLRQSYSFKKFIENYFSISYQVNDIEDISRIYSFVSSKINFDKEIKLSRPSSLSNHNLARIEKIFNEIPISDELKYDFLKIKNEIPKSINKKGYIMKDTKTIAIFCALKHEAEIISEVLKLEYDDEIKMKKGFFNGVLYYLVVANSMGRVSAAIKLMSFFEKFTVDCVIVAGIAGGFPKNKVKEGDLLIPSQCFDIANSKIEQKKDGSYSIKSRPVPYPLNDKFIEYINGGSFDLEAWNKSARTISRNPLDHMSIIHTELIVSCDNVIKSPKWAEEAFLTIHEKITGVEMEAGGVCAAAKHKGIPVIIIRGVSDLANAKKKDNQWRDRASFTVAHLISYVDFNTIL